MAQVGRLVAHVGLVEGRVVEGRGPLVEEQVLVLRGGGRKAAPALRRDPVVRREVPGVQDERVARRGEVADRTVGVVLDDRRDVAVGVAARLPVAGHGEVDVVVDAAGQRVPARPAGGALVAGAVAVEELADEPGEVARVAEPRARLLGGVEGLEAAVDAAVVLHAVVLGVLARRELGARGAAQRVGGDGVGELHALVGQQPARDRHVVEVVVAHVVGEDEDEVGTVVSGVGGPVGVLRRLHHPHRAGLGARGLGAAVGGDRREGGDEDDQESGRDRLGPRTHLGAISLAPDQEGPDDAPPMWGQTRWPGPAFPKRHDEWGEAVTDR